MLKFDYNRIWGTNDIKNGNTLAKPDGNHSRVLKQFKDEIAEFNTVWALRTGG